jgi:hypothetical protein
MLRRALFSTYIVGAREKAVSSQFVLKSVVEEQLKHFPKFKSGSQELIVAGEDVVVVVGREEKKGSYRTQIANAVRLLQSKGIDGEVQIDVEGENETEAIEGELVCRRG